MRLMPFAAIAVISLLYAQTAVSNEPSPEAQAATTSDTAQENNRVGTTKTGLEYEVLVEGSGPKPIAADTVTVHYKGMLANGNVFDSSYDRGAPATFPLNRVIEGWTEGLQLMSVGSKYRFIIPPYLGYGSEGAGAAIPPNATLIFEIELLSIN